MQDITTVMVVISGRVWWLYTNTKKNNHNDKVQKYGIKKNGTNKLVFTEIKYIDIIKEDVISTIINVVFKNNVCKDITLLLR